MAARVFLLSVAAACMAVSAMARAQAPQFAAYPAPVYAGPTAPLRLTHRDVMFRTRLREAVGGRANFAGHYLLAIWGCGADCQMGAAIDTRSGHVVWLPGTVCCQPPQQADSSAGPVLARPDSRLIMLSGLIDEGGAQGRHYYLLEGDRFVHLMDVAVTAR